MVFFLKTLSVCLSVVHLKGLHTLWSCRTELTDVISRWMAIQARGQVQLCCFDSETLCAHTASSPLIPTSCMCMCIHALLCVRLIEGGNKCGLCECAVLCKAAQARWLRKWVRLTSFKLNLPVGCYFYSMAVGIQQEQRNLSKYSFGATGRRNQSHKNRALNRVPLNWLLELYRNGHFTAGRALRGHAVFTRLQFRLNKVMLHFQPALTTAFFKWYLIPSRPQCPLTIIQPETHLKRGCAWEEEEELLRTAADEGSDAEAATPLSRAHPRLSPSVCGSVCYMPPGLWHSEWKSQTGCFGS